MLKLKLQYFGYLRVVSLEKTLMLGKTEVRRRRGGQKRWLDGINQRAYSKFTQNIRPVACLICVYVGAPLLQLSWFSDNSSGSIKLNS